MHRCWSILLCTLAAIGCGGGTTPQVGAKPEISGLSYQPATASVGQQANMSATVSFSDDDRDVESAAVEIRPPSGPAITPARIPLRNIAGLTRGVVQFGFAFTPSMAGTYTFDLWIIDTHENTSNRLSGTVTAQ